ncbi:MAG: tetratricopeptide repeat protein [Brevinema sp.]
MNKIRFTLLFFLTVGLIDLSFAQQVELPTDPAELGELPTNEVTLPEIIDLRMEFLNEDISQEKLFRLASFYLSSKCYIKSAELYGFFLSRETENPHRSIAHYNRALSLFSLGAYESSATEFWYAYDQNNQMFDALRMMGSIAYLKKDKGNSLFYWKKYLAENTVQSPERDAIVRAVALLESPGFTFETEGEPKQEPNPNWPFKNPDLLPYPDSGYDKKRVI